MTSKILSIVGELLLIAGVFIGGFVLWYFVEEQSIGQEQVAEAQNLRMVWEAATDDSDPAVGEEWVQPEVGTGFAIIQVPRFGEDFERVIAEGVGSRVMNDRKTGVGHYPSTGMPGEQGNFAIAAHRLGNSGPFRDADQLEAGDEILITMGNTTWVYQVTRQEIVLPHEGHVLEATPGKYELTMTTCHPMWQWHERLIVKAELAKIIRHGQVEEVNPELSDILSMSDDSLASFAEVG